MKAHAAALCAVALIVFAAATHSAHAGRFFLSIDPTGAGPMRLPVYAGFNETVYVMVDLEPGESSIGLSISLHTDTRGVFSVADVEVLNPEQLVIPGTRWNFTEVKQGDSPTRLIEEMFGFFGIFAGGGMWADRYVIAGMLNDPTYSPETGFAPFVKFRLSVDPLATQGDLWLSAGARTIVVTPGELGALVGMGDDLAPNSLVVPSGRPDSIFVIPEPASLALFGLGASALFRRRKRRPFLTGF